MKVKKVTIRGIDIEAWEIVSELRMIERRFIGAILSEAIIEYWQSNYEQGS
jgi:hypothetical protein